MSGSLHKQQSGIVSMVAVIFISILLSIIVLSMVRLTNTENRLATDYLLSTKASYAAEAGVEEALARLKTSGPFTQNSCINDVEVEPSVTFYTCQLVEADSSEFTDKIRPSQAVQVDLSGASPGFSQLRMSWYQKRLDDGSSSYSPYPAFNPRNPAADQLPLLRAELIRYRKGTFNRSAIQQAVFFLKPKYSGSNSGAPVWANYTSAGSTAQSPDVACDPFASDGQYVCDFTVSSLDTGNYNYVLRVSTYYERAAISFKLDTLDGAGTEVVQNNLMASIDVTARATDVFRRLRYRVPLTSTSSLPPYALGASGDICKDMEVSTIDGERASRGGNDGCSLTAD